MKKLKLFMMIATCSSFVSASAFAYLTKHPHPTKGHATAAATLECKAHTKNVKSKAYDLKKKRRLPLVRYYYKCTNPSNGGGATGALPGAAKCKVAYGDFKSGKVKVKELVKRPIPYKCGNKLFGDPAPGVKKQCSVNGRLIPEGKPIIIGPRCKDYSASSSSSSSKNPCEKYANQAVAAQKENLNRKCGYTGGAWSLDYNSHYSWCKKTKIFKRLSETRKRSSALKSCKMKPSVSQKPGVGKPIASKPGVNIGKPVAEKPMNDKRCAALLKDLQTEGSLIEKRSKFEEIRWAQDKINKLMAQARKYRCK